jgi:hypothetical protein
MSTIGDRYRKNPSRGFGDTVAKVIKAVAPKVEECGACAQRKAALNRLIPYKQKG